MDCEREMATPGIANFTVLDSIYGKFIINRHCTFQAEHLVKTGVPHIQSELNIIQDIKTYFQGLPYQFYVMDQLNVLGCSAPRASAAKLSVNANPA